MIYSILLLVVDTSADKIEWPKTRILHIFFLRSCVVTFVQYACVLQACIYGGHPLNSQKAYRVLSNSKLSQHHISRAGLFGTATHFL